MCVCVCVCVCVEGGGEYRGQHEKAFKSFILETTIEVLT